MAVRAHLFRAGGAVTAAAALAVAGLAASGAAATSAGVRSGGTWGTAQEVLAALAPSRIVSVSCASPGNCSAGGSRTGSAAPDGGKPLQAIVVSEKNGVWGKAEKVPGSGALNTGGHAEIFSVSCASAGNCSAGGWYRDRFGQQAMVVSEKNGVWGKAEKVPGTGSLNPGANAPVISVSCASPGNCSAGGYTTVGFLSRGFVVSQANGVWGKAERVPSLPGVDIRIVRSVSCTSAGNCVAGGYFTVPPAASEQAFIVTQKNGRWGTALPIGGMGEVDWLSCGSAGNCSAGGGRFVVSETNGTWGTAQQVPGLAALSTGGDAFITSVSCRAAGSCSAGGYTTLGFHTRAFVVSQDHGTWGKAQRVPGLTALNRDEYTVVVSVACASAGNCVAGGNYLGHSGFQQGFVVTQRNGTWGKVQQIPGLVALNRGGLAAILSMSCAPAGTCSAGGIFENRNHRIRAFVVSQTSRPPARSSKM